MCLMGARQKIYSREKTTFHRLFHSQKKKNGRFKLPNFEGIPKNTPILTPKSHFFSQNSNKCCQTARQDSISCPNMSDDHIILHIKYYCDQERFERDTAIYEANVKGSTALERSSYGAPPPNF